LVAEAEEIELLNYYLSLVISPVFEDAIPFTTACTEDMDPLAWWEKIARIPSGECDVLAVRCPFCYYSLRCLTYQAF
jgi:hypothetical protein